MHPVHLELLRALLSQGFSLAEMTSCLTFASIHGRLENMRELLEPGAKVEASRPGKTALMYACQLRRIEAARLLLAHGASKAARDSEGMTPLMYVPADCEELKDLVRE